MAHHEEFLVGKLLVIPTNRSNQEFEAKSKEESTKSPKGEPQERHTKDEEAKELHNSHDPHVEELKKEEPIDKVVA